MHLSTGLPMGSSGSGASRSWRLQQWDIRGGPTTSQAPYPQSDMLVYPMSMAGRSAQDAAQQVVVKYRFMSHADFSCHSFDFCMSLTRAWIAQDVFWLSKSLCCCY